MDNTFNTPAVLSLCPGILGLERGLIRAIGDINVVAYVEIEAFICENLLAAMESGVLAPTPIWTNLKTFDPEPFRGKVHGIIGGYPCQPFSVAGQRNGENDPRHLWPYVFGTVRTIRPVWCFFENVGGHLSMGFDTVYKDLQSLGYNVEAGIFTASEVGAPHQRERLFILAMANPEIFAKTGLPVRTKQKQPMPRVTSEKFSNAKCFRSTSRDESTRREEGTDIDRCCERAELANAGEQHVKRDFGEHFNQGRRSFSRERPSGPQSFGDRWPAGPGQEQYEWEEARTTFAPLGRNANGNQNGIDIFHLNNVYEIYTAKKEGAIKALHELWGRIDTKKNEWTAGRLWDFLEQEILFTKMYGALQNQRLTIEISSRKTIQEIQKRSVRDMWVHEPFGNTPQGQECYQQLRREFADTMCILSYECSLARRQETESRNNHKAMQCLRENYKNAWWDVSETLSEVKEIWRPLSEKSSWERQLASAYKSYRLELFGTIDGYNFREDLLRALGNSVVEQTAELAFKTLFQKHLSNV